MVIQVQGPNPFNQVTRSSAIREHKVGAYPHAPSRALLTQFTDAAPGFRGLSPVAVSSFATSSPLTAIREHNKQVARQSPTPGRVFQPRVLQQNATTEQLEARPMMRAPNELIYKMFGQSADDVAMQLQAISLGNNCGIKLSIRRLGLDRATMPLDWIRSSVEGVLHWLQTNFQDFIAVEELECFDVALRDKAMRVFRSDMHSFWHDDLNDIQVREKLWRRVERFMDLANDREFADPRPLLFIRSMAGSSELGKTEALFESLKKTFEVNGRKVYLLAILEDQPITGVYFHSAYDGAIMYWVQPLRKGPLILDGDTPAPYEAAIAFAVRRILLDLGNPEFGDAWEREALNCTALRRCTHRQYPTVDRSEELLNPITSNGLQETEAGRWVGHVTMAGFERGVLFAAFSGIDGHSGTDPGGLDTDRSDIPPYTCNSCNSCNNFCDLPSNTLLGTLMQFSCGSTAAAKSISTSHELVV